MPTYPTPLGNHAQSTRRVTLGRIDVQTVKKKNAQSTCVQSSGDNRDKQRSTSESLLQANNTSHEVNSVNRTICKYLEHPLNLPLTVDLPRNHQANCTLKTDNPTNLDPWELRWQS